MSVSVRVSVHVSMSVSMSVCVSVSVSVSVYVSVSVNDKLDKSQSLFIYLDRKLDKNLKFKMKKIFKLTSNL